MEGIVSQRVRTEDAAKEIGCNPQYLRNQVRNGEWDLGYCAKPRKPGGKYTCYIFRGKLDAFLGKRDLDPGDSEEKHEKKS